MDNNQKQTLLIGLAIVATFGVILVAYPIWKQPVLKNSIESQPIMQEENTENPMEKSLIYTDNLLDTSTWKTFQSEETDIVFKYPANWYINESQFKNTLPDQPLKQITLSNYNQDKISGSDAPLPPQFIRITILSFADIDNLQAWSKKLGFSKPETLKINGIKALRDRHVYRGPDQGQDNPRFYGDVTILLNKKIGYELSYGPTNSELANIFDLIVTSVNFK